MNSIISLTFITNYHTIGELLSYVRTLFEITFEERNSAYTGNYHKANFANGTIMIYPNFNEAENEWKYEYYKAYKYLIGIRIEKGKKIERQETGKFIEDIFVEEGFILAFRNEISVNS